MSNNPYFDTVFVDKSTILNLSISNIIPSSANDTLELSINRAKGCSIVGGGTVIQYYGKNIKLIGLTNNYIFSDTFSFKGTPVVSVEWKVKNNGIIATGNQNISPTEFGVSNYNINY